MAVVQPIGFSPNGEYLAFSSPDGILKLWETATGTLKQEYTPSSHLSATCSCLCWAPARQTNVSPRKKKKRRSSLGSEVRIHDLIALGTTSGSILLYSFLKGDLQTQLSDGHTDVVHGVCWHPSGEVLYTCSADQHIIQWDLITGSVKHKWKGDRGSVYSLSLGPLENTLLSAGRTIKMWDLNTRHVLKTFTGHASEVFQLLPVPCLDCHAEQRQENSGYFLSAARGDRHIHAWRSNLDSPDKNTVASFALTEEAVQLTVCVQSKEQAVLLAVVTTNGLLLVFEHILNGFSKKPLKPKVSIQVASEGRPGETPKPISVLGAHINDDDDTSVLMAHGNFIKPTFEKLSYKSLEPKTCLVRSDPSHTSITKDKSVTKVRTPHISDDVTVLSPGHMAPSVPTQLAPESSTASQRKKRKKSISKEMSLDERLSAISIEHSAAGKTQPPRADTLATLLAQGLQSKDKKILNNVLQHTDETIIRNTIQRLPVPVIIPLVEELSVKMHGHAQSGHTLVKWMKTVLSCHASYLMTFPELVDKLSSIYQMMDSRVLLFSRLSKVQGKLDLMLSQITSQTEDDDETAAAQQPLLLYQDESSEEDIDEDLVADNSESDSNWENGSGAEENGHMDEEENEDEEEDMDAGDEVDESESSSD